MHVSRLAVAIGSPACTTRMDVPLTFTLAYASVPALIMRAYTWLPMHRGYPSGTIDEHTEFDCGPQ